MVRNAASFLVVELMRQGRSPAQACREAIDARGAQASGGEQDGCRCASWR
jgi:isoaspartyl peptidase/L-asparaginase-like protein (Ntn-hydrolase superfamily)